MKKRLFTIFSVILISLTLNLNIMAVDQNTPQPNVNYVVALSSTQLKVIFEGSINENIALDISNYSISNFNNTVSIDISSSKYNSSDNSVILTTATDFHAGMIYKLVINNICSSGKVVKYFAGMGPKPVINVNSVESISTSKIKVTFNGDVKKHLVTNKSNYYITKKDSDTPVSVLETTFYSHDNIVILTTSPLEACSIYDLDIKNICSTGNTTYAFKVTPDKPTVTVKSVIAISNTQVKIIYDGNIEMDKVEDLSNYIVYIDYDNTEYTVLNSTYNHSDNSVILTLNNSLKYRTLYIAEIHNICSDGIVVKAFAGRY